jgi:hypothetical protein
MPRRRQRLRVSFPRDAATADRVGAVAESTRGVRALTGLARWTRYAVRPADLRRSWLVLSLDDYSEIPFVKQVVGVPWYQYRARVRCGDGDFYAVARPDIEGYEAYNRQVLGLGNAHGLFVSPSGSGLPLARLLMDDRSAFERLVGAARRAGGLQLHPYMAIEPVWELAEAVETAAGVPVRVLGPLPETARLANDKARFSDVVARLLGHESLVHTATSADPLVVAEQLRDVARRGDAVALKMPSCASGMGNRVFESDAIRDRPIRAVRELVDRFLVEKEWDGRETLLAVEWHRDVIESPSSQCWIPPLGGGEPEVEGVYEQSLVGEEQVFEGALLSGLPARIRRDFIVRSWLLCRVFQQLGYVGRCSFDGVVVGRSLDDAQVKFVECNGRWGGTSVPMHLMQRVFGDHRAVPYKAQDYIDERLRGLEFEHLLEIFGDTLYDRRTGKGRVLLYNVGGVPEHGKFDIVVTGRSFAEVYRFIDEGVPARISRYLGSRRERR